MCFKSKISKKVIKNVHGNKIFITLQQYLSGKYMIDDTPINSSF